MESTPIEIVKNHTDLPWVWEIIGILSSILLSGAALYISLNASRFAKKQQEREEDMRQRELKIAAFDKILDVYGFIIKDLRSDSFFDKANKAVSINRLNTVSYISFFLFEGETYSKLQQLINIIGKILNNEDVKIEELLEAFKEYGYNVTSEEQQKVTDLYKNDVREMVIYHIYHASALIGKRIFAKYRLIIKIKK